jgi:hypothetical protein
MTNMFSSHKSASAFALALFAVSTVQVAVLLSGPVTAMVMGTDSGMQPMMEQGGMGQNQMGGQMRQWQQLDYEGRYSHSYMDALPDFVKLAEAYGHVGLKIEKPSDVEPALIEAMRLKDRTVFLDIRTDPTENVWPMVKAGKGISEMLLGSEDL